MTDREKIKLLCDALNKINGIVYANTIRPGSADYFEVRNTAVNAIKAVGEIVT